MVLVALITCGCKPGLSHGPAGEVGKTPVPTAAETPANHNPQPANRAPAPPWQEGVVDPASGQLVAFWVLRDEGPEPALINEDYGMFLLWGKDRHLFCLFDNPRRRHLVTHDFELFLEELGKLPAGIPIFAIDTCTVSRWWGMPAPQKKQVYDVLRKGNRTISERPHTVCYCESRGLRYLADPRAADPNTPAAPAP